MANNASPLQRSWVAPPLIFSLAFIDSSIQGLCTESWVSLLCIHSDMPVQLAVVVLMQHGSLTCSGLAETAFSTGCQYAGIASLQLLVSVN